MINRSLAHKLPYMPGLTGLRGFSILCVLIFHANVHWLPGGFLSVDIFFVLSGFLISAMLTREFDHTGQIDLKRFYLRRARRLLPALIAMLLTFTVMMAILHGSQGFADAIQESAVALFYVSNWTRALDWHAPQYLGHTWSLSIEEQYYLLWPICLLWILCNRRLNPLKIALSMALISALWRAWLASEGASVNRLYNGTDTRLDGLMLGACIGIAYARGMLSDCSSKLSSGQWQACGLAALTLIAWCLLGVKLWLDMRLYYWLLHLFQWLAVVLVVVLLVVSQGVLYKIFNNQAMYWLGGISYGLYLWHWPIYRLMQDIGASPISILIFGGGITLLVAQLSWSFVERPILLVASKRF